MFRWLARGVVWSVILAIAGVLVVAVLVPRLFGATPYTVLTGSMQPHYPPGTLIVTRPSDDGTYRVGDVITYQRRSGEAAVVTHRVVAATSNLRGEISYLTQGDANNVVDADPVRPVQVKGRVWYSLPHLGRVNDLLTGSQRQLAVYVVGGALMLYAVAMFTSAFTSAARDRARRAQEPVDHDD